MTQTIPNYQTILAEAVKTEIVPLYETAVRIEKEIGVINGRLKAQRQAADALDERLTALKGEISAAMGDAEADVEAVRKRYEQALAEQGTHTEFIRTAEDELLPQKTEALNGARLKLRNALTALMRTARPVADAVVNDLLRQALAERDRFIDHFSQLAHSFGVSMTASDESLCPGCLAAETCGIVAASLDHARERMKTAAPKEPDAQQDRECAPSTAPTSVLTGVVSEPCDVTMEHIPESEVNYGAGA